MCYFLCKWQWIREESRRETIGGLLTKVNIFGTIFTGNNHSPRQASGTGIGATVICVAGIKWPTDTTTISSTACPSISWTIAALTSRVIAVSRGAPGEEVRTRTKMTNKKKKSSLVSFSKLNKQAYPLALTYLLLNLIWIKISWKEKKKCSKKKHWRIFPLISPNWDQPYKIGIVGRSALRFSNKLLLTHLLENCQNSFAVGIYGCHGRHACRWNEAGHFPPFCLES